MDKIEVKRLKNNELELKTGEISLRLVLYFYCCEGEPGLHAKIVTWLPGPVAKEKGSQKFVFGLSKRDILTGTSIQAEVRTR